MFELHQEIILPALFFHFIYPYTKHEKNGGKILFIFFGDMPFFYYFSYGQKKHVHFT